MTKSDKPHAPLSFDEILTARLSRRAALSKGAKGAAVVGVGSAGLLGLASCSPPVDAGAQTALAFTETPHAYDATHHVAEGYNADILIRWGDPVLADAPAYTPNSRDAAAQEKQFGFNNDFIAFMPLPIGSSNSDHGLLCVNHEYTSAHMMFSGYKPSAQLPFEKKKSEVDVEMAAHGHSILEVKRVDGAWQVIADSQYNRRITANTPMVMTGPVAGHRRLQTSADPTGKNVLGTLNNCAGGMTPWGTVLIAEENFGFYFDGDQKKSDPEERRSYNSLRVGYYLEDDPAGRPVDDNALQYKGRLPINGWFRFYDRFNIEKEPREANRFGWMVEIDPYDPTSVPKKRTALGRFSHEGATIVAEAGKPVIAYSGDDGRHEFLYKFVSKNNFDPANREANLNILAEGDLYAARFDVDGTGQWIKLALADSPWLNPDIAGLKDQGDALIESRETARLLGATPLDRPEDVETNPVTGRTYLMLTNNSKRKIEETDAVNPRAENRWGQIVEISPPGQDGNRDHWSTSFEWDLIVLAGDPDHPDPAKRGRYHADTSEAGWFSCPDNVAFDPSGNMWIATDGMPSNKDSDGKDRPIHDGLWACETVGEKRALTKHFFGCPRGAELCGPCFTPDGTSLFVAIQHPGDGDGATFTRPSTRWPDFDPNGPPRPSVVVITKKDGGLIGT